MSLYRNVANRRKKGLPKKKPGQKGYPKDSAWPAAAKTAKKSKKKKGKS
jgi:hypothetical protein